MPPSSRFGGGCRAKKKQGVIDKMKVFFEKYYGVGGSSAFTEQEPKGTRYEVEEELPLVAEPEGTYGKRS